MDRSRTSGTWPRHRAPVFSIRWPRLHARPGGALWTVAALMRAEDIDHAIQMANSIRYGLSASVFTTSLSTAMAFVDRINADWFGSTKKPRELSYKRHSEVSKNPVLTPRNRAAPQWTFTPGRRQSQSGPESHELELQPNITRIAAIDRSTLRSGCGDPLASPVISRLALLQKSL